MKAGIAKRRSQAELRLKDLVLQLRQATKRRLARARSPSAEDFRRHENMIGAHGSCSPSCAIFRRPVGVPNTFNS
jgi:hypothetical protein